MNNSKCVRLIGSEIFLVGSDMFFLRMEMALLGNYMLLPGNPKGLRDGKRGKRRMKKQAETFYQGYETSRPHATSGWRGPFTDMFFINYLHPCNLFLQQCGFFLID